MSGEKYRYMYGTTLKNSLDYHVGEKIVFKLCGKEEEENFFVPKLSYQFKGDDGQVKSGIADCSEDGCFYLETTLEKCGAVMLSAKACDAEGKEIAGVEPFGGAAIADLDDIRCGTAVPADYDDFWATLKKEVDNTPPDVLYCKKIENPDSPDFEIFDMRIRAPRDSFVSAMVAYPKNAQPGSLKFLMWFNGYAVEAIPPRPIEGHLSVFVNAHAIPNAETDAYYKNLLAGELAGYGFDLEENRRPETTYWAKMFSRNLQAVRYFKDHPLVNGKDYIFSGSSQGGMQACNIAAHTGIATGLLLNVPWLADLGGYETLGRMKNGMPQGDGVHYFDTAIAASRVKCPVYIISGLGDTTCPPATQLTIFNAIATPKYHEFYQNKGHSYTIPRNRVRYVLGDTSLADGYPEMKHIYYQ